MKRRVSRHDVRGFRSLYEDHYGFVWSTVRRLGVRPDAVDDAVQDAFLIAFRRWDDLPTDRRRAWLYGIARRVSSNARKVERRRVRKHDAFRHRQPRAFEVAGRLEASATLDRFLGELEPADRELFVLGAVEGLTGKELAAALGAKPSTLYGRLQGLRARFKDAAGGDATTAVERARSRRPAASAASWALMLPKLGVATLSPALGIGMLAAAAVAVVTVSATAAPEQPPGRLEAGVVASVSVPDSPPAVEPTPAPTKGATASPQSSPTPARQQPAPRPRAAEDPVAAEAALVQQLRRHVQAGESSDALRLVARHAKRHPQGVLRDAVGALHVEVLCDLGRRDDAQARAEALLRHHPNTPVARRVSQGCRSKKNDASVVNADADGHGGG